LAQIRKRKKFPAEIDAIGEEIARSKRFGFHFGVLAIEVNDSVPRGLSRIIPGKTISFHVLENNIRVYDKVIGPIVRRYFIILPQTSEKGICVVKKRVHKIAVDHRWGNLRIGTACYPIDGNNALSLLEIAISRLSHAKK